MKRSDDGTRIFVDISSLRDYLKDIERYSGIQRTIMTLAKNILELPENISVFLTYLDDRESTHYCIDCEQIGIENLQSAERMRRILSPKSAVRLSIKPLLRYKDSRTKYHFHRIKLDILSVLGKNKPFRRYNMTARMWRDARSNTSKTSPPPVLVTPRKLADCASRGDHFLSMDSAWQKHHTAAFRDVKEMGMVIHTFVHDLIPIVAPGTVDGTTCEIFYDWLVGTIEYTDHYLANSDATRTDLVRFLSSCGVDTDVKTVPLAQAGLPEPILEDTKDLQNANFQAGHLEAYPFFFETLNVSGTVRNIASSPFILCVGTIESRKNCWRIAMAWKTLLDSGKNDLPQLVFAGRWGSLCADFNNLMHATGNLYGYVNIVEAPSDEELGVLYRHCEFLVMASTYEGWGLPVGEALAYGKTAVVSNGSSLPEVGGDLVEYCDPYSISSISDAMLRLWSDPHRRSELELKIREAKLRSWLDVAHELYRAMACV